MFMNRLTVFLSKVSVVISEYYKQREKGKKKKTKQINSQSFQFCTLARNSCGEAAVAKHDFSDCSQVILLILPLNCHHVVVLGFQVWGDV